MHSFRPSLLPAASLAAALALAVSPVLVAPLSAEEGFRAGAAAVDITPQVFPMHLRSGRSNHVHDPFHVRAVAFQNGEGRAAIALIDALGIGRDITDRAKAVVAERTGWSPAEMLVSATHTHTAPKGGEGAPEREAFEERRFQGIVDALAGAIESLEPARVGFAKDEEPDEVYNRRWHLKPGTMGKNPFGGYDQVRTNAPRQHLLKPAGPVDPEVCIVDVRNAAGRPLALVANYSLHYVGGIPQAVEEDGRRVGMASADYFGEFARIMPYRVGGSNPPENFVAMMTNGTSGDINNIDFVGRRGPRAPFEQAQVVARKTADAAWRAVQKIESYETDPVVGMRQREVALKYRNMSEEEVAHALRLLELPRADRESIHTKATQYANATVRYSEPDKTENVLVQAIRIGDQAIVSFPFEVLVEIGLEIKERSPFPHTFTISLANGGYGYLPPPHQFDLGGYETWIGTARFDRDSSVVLTETLLEMLEELRALE